MNFKTSGDVRVALDGATGALFVVLSKALQIQSCVKKSTCFVRQRGFSPILFGLEVRNAWRSISPLTAGRVKYSMELCWYARDRGLKDFRDNPFSRGALQVCCQEDFDSWRVQRGNVISRTGVVHLINQMMQWRDPGITRAEADFCAQPIICDKIEQQRDLNYRLFKLVTRVCKSVGILAEHIRRQTGEVFLVKFTASDPFYSAI